MAAWGSRALRRPRPPVDNLCATCSEDVDTAGTSGDSAVNNLAGAVDNRS